MERVILAVLCCAVGINMGFHGHSNALDIDLVISGRALRADMAGVAVARCTANPLLRGTQTCPMRTLSAAMPKFLMPG